MNSCADEVIQELSKELQAGYDFALNKFNLLLDHELRVLVQRPLELKVEEEREVEAEEPQNDEVTNDPPFQNLLLKDQVNVEGLVHDNAPVAEKEPPASSKAVANHGDTPCCYLVYFACICLPFVIRPRSPTIVLFFSINEISL